MSSILDLLGQPEFLIGLAGGFIALVLFIAIDRDRPLPLALAVVCIAAVDIYVSLRHGLGLTFAVAILASGGCIMAWSDSGPVRRVLLHIAGVTVVFGGAIAVTRLEGMPSEPWARVGVAAVVVLLGSALGTRWDEGTSTLTGLLLAVSFFGIWTTVPETDGARALVGAAIPLSLASLPGIGARIFRPGAFALAGVVGFVVVTGGQTRASAVVGGIGAMGLFLLFPAIRGHFAFVSGAAVFTAHAVLVLLAARVFGLMDNVWVALVGTALAFVVTAWALLALARRAMWVPDE